MLQLRGDVVPKTAGNLPGPRSLKYSLLCNIDYILGVNIEIDVLQKTSVLCVPERKGLDLKDRHFIASFQASCARVATLHEAMALVENPFTERSMYTNLYCTMRWPLKSSTVFILVILPPLVRIPLVRIPLVRMPLFIMSIYHHIQSNFFINCFEQKQNKLVFYNYNKYGIIIASMVLANLISNFYLAITSGIHLSSTKTQRLCTTIMPYKICEIFGGVEEFVVLYLFGVLTVVCLV